MTHWEDKPIKVCAAGSLRNVLSEISEAYQRQGGLLVETTFGPSGLLRERLETGWSQDLFASANTGHPLTLFHSGLAGPPVVFARNNICLYGRIPDDISDESLIDYLLAPETRLGISTPGSDPSGDYAWELFGKIDALRPGSLDILQRKARQLVGGPGHTSPLTGPSPVLALFENNVVDVFIGYRTTAVQIRESLPDIRILALPPRLAIMTECALAVLKTGHPRAHELGLFMLSQEGQRLVSEFGFKPVNLPFNVL